MDHLHSDFVQSFCVAVEFQIDNGLIEYLTEKC